MRLRFVPGARELIEEYSQFIHDDKEHTRLDLNQFFPKSQPVMMEIGMGKGQFIYELEKTNPNFNYIGIEKFDSAIVKGLEKLVEEPLDNLRLVRMDALYLLDLFAPHSLSRIYLNFSDPWPKHRHQKRRLTHAQFLQQYQLLLKEQGDIHFKTDNDDLFAFSLESMKQYGMEIITVDYDLHQDPNRAIISTEFEDKFVEQGIPIKHLIARFKEEK
jgi:tRNA (guanine-N7-)-methyltransferase